MIIPWRKIHRWLGLLVGFQVVAWMLSGLYFAWIPIDEIRGEHLTHPAETIAAADLTVVGDPALIQAAIGAIPGDPEIVKFELRKLRNRLVYRLEYSVDSESAVRLFDAASGAMLAKIDSAEAGAIVNEALLDPAGIQSVELVTEHQTGSEYRGRALPLYRVIPESDSDLRVYVDAWTGEIVARRTGQWRLFDLLWALHIMDYQDRDDFNHPLLIIFAAAALVLSVGGYVLWWISSVWMRNRRRSANT
jgi:uncharacterized iron-regulated membrane protein